MNGKKVLITGASGMLGSNLLKLLKYKDIVGYDSSELDVANSENVRRVTEREVPDIIIHTAAYTNVEACESDIDKAYLINTIGTQNLVNCCIDKDILFIYVSSTGIYGKDKDSAYTEFDSVQPATVHHKAKYEAEKVVQNHLNKFLIIRTGWLFGGSITHQKNFVYKRYLEAKNNSLIYSDNSQTGNPTYIKNLVDQIQVLIDSKQYGIFNCVDSAENISRYDYVKKIVELFELNCDVKTAPKNMFKRAAPVSPNESAKNYKLDLLNLNVMENWEDSLKRYIDSFKSEL